MSNNYKLYIIFFLFIKTICDDEPNTNCKGSSESLDDCQELLSNYEKSYNKSCCFFTAEKDELDINQCILLNKSEYNNLDLFEEKYYSDGYLNVDIECGAFYFEINIILFYLIIIFYIIY